MTLQWTTLSAGSSESVGDSEREEGPGGIPSGWSDSEDGVAVMKAVMYTTRKRRERFIIERAGAC